MEFYRKRETMHSVEGDNAKKRGVIDSVHVWVNCMG